MRVEKRMSSFLEKCKKINSGEKAKKGWRQFYKKDCKWNN